MQCQISYGAFTSKFDTHEEHIEAFKCKEYIEKEGFKFLGWWASEGLYMTSAWLETENFVFCLSDAKPFNCELNGIIFPDPFNHPVSLIAPVCISIYQKPFKPFEWAGEEPEVWVMDGSPPSAIDDEAYEREVITKNAEEAVRFIKWLVCNITLTASIENEGRVISQDGANMMKLGRI